MVLPGASFAEKEGTFTNTDRTVLRVRKAIEPVGKARPDWRVLCDVARRLGAAVTLAPADDVVWSAAFEAAGLFSALPRLSAGMEAWIGGLGARAGFDGRGPTFGLSVRFSNLQFDWAYAMRDDLGDSHRVSFTYRF